MFGFKTIRTDELNGLRSELTELKGYYENREKELNEYFRIIAPQLKGIECGSVGTFSREAIKNCYETMAPVTGIINYIADAVGDIAEYLELYDIKRGEYIENSPIINLLSRPNDRFTKRKFFTAWAINKLLFGDAFTYAPLGVGKDRTPKEMYIIPSYKVAIEKGGYDKPFKGIMLMGTGNNRIELDGKVFQSFDYNLDDTSFFGQSKVAAAAVYLTVMDRAMNRQATSLKNGGPANLITPAASTSFAPLPAYLEDMEQKLNSGKNVNKNIAMKTAIEVHQLGEKPADLSILESHKDAMYVLCFLYKVPVDIYLGQSKYENAKEAKKTLYEQLAIPMANEFAEDFLHYLGLGNQYKLSINTEKIDVLKDSAADIQDVLGKMYASLNERREANGYARIEKEYADKPMIPMGMSFGNEMDFDISE